MRHETTSMSLKIVDSAMSFTPILALMSSIAFCMCPSVMHHEFPILVVSIGHRKYLLSTSVNDVPKFPSSVGYVVILQKST